MKNVRHQKILELIRAYDIDTQQTLINKLKESGFNVTQTTVSRDINQLKLIKAIKPDGTYKYVRPADNKQHGVAVNSAISAAVTAIDAARNLVVVKTYPGMANAVGVLVDSIEHDEVLGSVAGDDTILLVLKTDAAASNFEERLRRVCGLQNV